MYWSQSRNIKIQYDHENQIKLLNFSQYTYKAGIFYPHSTEGEIGTYEY